MPDVTLKLTGDRELAAAFRRKSAAVQGQKLVGALQAGALLVSNEAKRRAPYKTGNWRRSIHVGGESAHGTEAEVLVGSDVEYGPRLEFGFVGTDSLGRTYHQAARPHLRPALDAMAVPAQAEVAAALRDLIGGAT